MSNKTYLCTLTPISKFFFGGERTFGNEGDVKTNYLVRSNAFPQQTTVLGMLRFELLKQNSEKLLPINASNQAAVEKKIGKAGFKISENPVNYGIIEKLSPVFICKGTNKLILAPRDRVRYTNKEELLITDEQWEIDMNTTDKVFLFGADKEIHLPQIDKFHHKNYYKAHFLDKDGSSVPFDYNPKTKEGIFITDSQIGIKKPTDRKDNDNNEKGFYKQFYYRMNSGYAFGCYLEVSENITEQSSIVYMGADKSAFVLTIQDAKKSNFDTDFGVNHRKEGTKITLLSDAYVSEDIYQNCFFGLVDTLPFRNIETTVSPNTNYNRLHKSKYAKCLNLLARGSVLYPSNLAEVKKILDQGKDNFQKIGYNIFKID